MDFPVSLRLEGARALVVGGGAVALRKTKALRRAGACVVAVSPAFVPGFRRLRAARLRRRYRTADLRGAAVVVASTDDAAVNAAVSRDCRRRGIPVNVVDVPELCTFFVPAVVRRGPVTVAVSTGGRSPSLAAALRRRLEALLPTSLGPLAERLGTERRRLLRALPPSRSRTRRIKALVRGARLLGRAR